MQFRFRHKDGHYLWLQDQFVVVHDATGQSVARIGSVSDITERRRQEDEIQRLNTTLEHTVAERTAQLATAVVELKHAGKLKDEFMAAVSHELRTPLTGVLSMAEALEMQYVGPLNERQLHYVQSVHQSGARLLAMINGILRYTSLMAGNVTVHQERCILAELCAVGVHAIHEQATQKGLTLTFNVEPAGLTIFSDPEGIIQVIQQLLDNAVKFTPEGGQIGLEVREDSDAQTVHLVVRDTGIGMTAEQQAVAFQLFVQGDGSLARSYGGVGLGLAYTRRMVELLEGTIELESAPGAGSRFTITLPARRVPPGTA
ncbi:MAG: HAMP domain-containing histidine kinase [Anaerolineales bacterium]|nr:HAMP domain-containing histidine kinase [Anaerolineales bacterium]